MTEKSKWWPGNTVGHAVSFNSDNAADLAYTIYCRQIANRGPVRGVGSELYLTGSSSPLTLGAGAGFVRGYEYESNAGISVAVSTPATATRIDRIVLRANWTAQTVTAVLLSGTEGGGAPALTQNFGVTWEIPLWKVTVTTGGVFTLTDEREFCEFANESADVSDGRLTLSSGNSVPTSDVTAAVNAYFTPHLGKNKIVLCDGSSRRIYPFVEKQISLSGKAANTNFDVFGFPTSGALDAELLAWSSDTARATAVVDDADLGYKVKAGDRTRRLLGTIRTTGTIGQCEDSLLFRHVNNLYNRVKRPIRVYASFSCSNGAYNYWGDSSVNRVSVVNCLDLDPALVRVHGYVYGSMSPVTQSSGAGLDTVAGYTDSYGYVGVNLNGFNIPISGGFEKFMGIGWHYLAGVYYASLGGYSASQTMWLTGHVMG